MLVAVYFHIVPGTPLRPVALDFDRVERRYSNSSTVHRSSSQQSVGFTEHWLSLDKGG